MRPVLLILLFLHTAWATAQNEGTLRGTVRDELGNTLPQASVTLPATGRTVLCDDQGRYTIKIPAGESVLVRWSYTGIPPMERTVQLEAGEERTLDVGLKFTELAPVDIKDTRREREEGLTPLDPRITRFTPSVQGGIEALLQGQIGVAMRNELSAGYSVRGGNFDENLVYVNDIEVYRPFLARSGQQEGLSFPNPDMIDRLQFSPGGFEARYGDKMSSVLDIQYKRPKTFAGSAMASLMGGAVHLENTMLNKRLRQVTGFRYRTNTLILNGLDTKGQYRPRYADLQTYWTYDLTDRVELGFLGLYSSNKYGVVPENRETEYGSFNQALRFTAFFEGQEVTQFETLFGALNVNVQASRNLRLKFTGSAFNTVESERFDVLSEYFLDELERDPASSQYGEVKQNLGIGRSLEHARNDLDATVITLAHKAYLQHHGTQFMQWGVDARSEVIKDKLSEWTVIDSADFSIPLNTGEDLELNYSLKSKLNMESIRASAYLQNTWRWETGENRWWTLIAGARAQHWTYNGQTVASPRMRVTYHPGWKKVAEGDTVATEQDYSFWFAAGLYYQPPFYREVRRLDGTLNPDIRAQESFHLVLGMDRRFTIWERPFKFTSEAYYKKMDQLIPYEVDNVRIRYYGANLAKGYATGLDLKLNGEFIEGVESWVGVSVMSTQEDLYNDSYTNYYNAAGELITPGYTFDQVAVDSTVVYPGWIPRPTDQRVNVAFFFQDEMPGIPTLKVHLSTNFGTGVPFGPPNQTRYADTLRTTLYRRVDIGFSKQLLGAKGQEKQGFLGKIDNMWVSLEVFNLLNINNTITHTWIESVDGRQYSIPDYLTPRRYNLKLIAWF
ncbi:MAG TPA: carboxypeptidase regulatory-like domain-containing protein [Flavobacteriales bacterium]|nr:carboxypeptidase regulatory-like domain-containing protein [Flavobacteriales bacterium]